MTSRSLSRRRFSETLIEKESTASAVLSHGKGGTQMESVFPDRRSTESLKGIFTFFVILRHINNRCGLVSDWRLLLIFDSMGYLSVAMYFFISGFGLMRAYKTRAGYLGTFPQRRLLPFYTDCLFTIVLYAIFRFFTTGFTAGEFFRSMLFGYTIVENGWYLQAILVFYVLFYFVFSTKLGTGLKVFLMLAASMIYMDVCIHYGRGDWWYSSILSLTLGFTWGACAERIEAFLSHRRKYLLALPASLAVFCALFSLSVVRESIVFKMLSAPAFSVFVILLVRAVRVDCGFFRFLGKRSFQIYSLHGICLLLWRTGALYITDRYAFAAASLVSSYALALALYPVYGVVERGVIGILRRLKCGVSR